VRGYTILIAVPCTTSGTATEGPPPPPPSDCATVSDLLAARDYIVANFPTGMASAAQVSALEANVIAAIIAAKQEILAALAAPPPEPQGYVKIGAVQYDSLADAAAAASAGALVEIYGGLRDLKATAAFPRSCTILGMTPDAKLEWTLGVTQPMANGKGLIVCTAYDPTSVFTVENLELCGAKVSDANGAGVRGDGCAQITVRNCYIHNNENGVLSVAKRQFYYGNTLRNNGYPDGQAHGVYVNDPGVDEVTAENNTLYAAVVGNQFKCRAKKLTFRHNLVAELDGSCSWQVDIPNGGDALVEFNVIEQGPNAQNTNLVSYGFNGLPADGRVNNLAFRDNIVINDNAANAGGIVIFNQPAALEVVRNSWVGAFSQHVTGHALDATNAVHADRAAAGMLAYPALPGVP
jgi:hypothetical protein